MTPHATAPSSKIGSKHQNALTNMAGALGTLNAAITGKDSPTWALQGSGHGGFYRQDGKR